jgi:flagellar biosynthesis protein FlhG
MTRIITVTSAAGGVGTSSIALNLAAQLARLGQRVCLLDAEPGAPVIAARLGLQPSRNLRHLVLDALPLEEVLIRGCQGIDVLPGAAGHDWIADPKGRQRLAAALSRLDAYDWLLIDSVAGAKAAGLSFALASPELVVTLTPRPARLAEAYALLKLLAMHRYTGRISIVVNRSANEDTARQACERLSEPVRRHLDMPLTLLGGVREDRLVQDGVVPEPSLLRYAPDSPAARDVAALARALLAGGRPEPGADGAAFADAWLQRAGGPAVAAIEFGISTSRDGRRSREHLEEQVEALTVQVDQLVAEMTRLREEGEDIARLVASPEVPERGGPARSSNQDLEAWIAGRATGSEDVRIEELSFPVYQLLRPDNTTLRVALHQPETEREEAAPRNTSP